MIDIMHYLLLTDGDQWSILCFELNIEFIMLFLSN